MSEDVIIKVDGVSKKFCTDLKRSLWYGLQDIARSSVAKRSTFELRKDEFWATDNVSFEVKRGECIGLIGHNGAGKSTLLKMLNGIIKPDKGTIRVNGRVGALIELGAGFDPILTGRENIYNNGAVLGFSKSEIDNRLEEIIEFSEIGEFIDSPVRNYSSGMKVRLGFAVASNLDPDVLLIDEVLAVGDTGFRLKCYNKLDQLMEKAAVIFVSHSIPQVMRMSTSILLLDRGKVEYIGEDLSEGVDRYFTKFRFNIDKVFRNENCRLDRFEVIAQVEHDAYVVPYLSDFICEIDVWVAPKFLKPVFTLVFFDKELKGAATAIQHIDNSEDGHLRLHWTVPALCLSKGKFSVTLNINGSEHSSLLFKHQGICEIQVTSGKDIRWTPVLFQSSCEVNSEG